MWSMVGPSDKNAPQKQIKSLTVNHGQNLALTVLCVPCSLDSGGVQPQRRKPEGQMPFVSYELVSFSFCLITLSLLKRDQLNYLLPNTNAEGREGQMPFASYELPGGKVVEVVFEQRWHTLKYFIQA